MSSADVSLAVGKPTHGDRTAPGLNLPDAIGLGFRRCASSWLHSALNSHPGIAKPKNGVHFFSDHRNRGADWYQEQLPRREPGQVLVDFSVSYAYPEHSAHVAAAIRDLLPEAKLFAVVRHPVDRAFSDYLRSVRRVEIPCDLTFEAAIEQHPVLLERGLYGRLMAPFYDRFPADRIRVMTYDDLIESPEAFLAALCDFLGVSSFQLPAAPNAEAPGATVSSTLYNRAILECKGAIDRMFLGLGLSEQWSDVKARHHRLYRWVLSLNERPATVAPATRRRLWSYYRDDVANFERLSRADLGRWQLESDGQ